MDITAQNFQSLLPSLIAAIAEAQFVAIDFELSGIASRQNKSRPDGGHRGGKPSLQQRYEETKQAAETFQILQMGLTCVGESRDRGVYVVRPFNFFLNPCPDDYFRLERVFAYSTVHFLIKHNFRMDAPFYQGVQYLSRAEEAKVRQSATQRQSKANIPNIPLDPSDKRTSEFMERLRNEVNMWKNRTTLQPDYLNIAPIDHDRPPYSNVGLNGFQKRLVHQYIRAEHPDLVTISKPGFVQIVACDKEREDAEEERRNRTFEEKLIKQIGLRWLIEAIHGGDLSALNQTHSASAGRIMPEPLSTKYASLWKQLQGVSTTIVGHNLFSDLIYFYACFIGPLPDKIEDFQQTIHTLFPRIIDTKPLHEAGFDSLMTAKVLLRLATKLDVSEQYLDSNTSNQDEQSYHTPPEGPSPDEAGGGVLIELDTVSEHLRSTKRSLGSSQSNIARPPAYNPFSHVSRFDLLASIHDDEDPADEETSSTSSSAEPPEGKVDNETGRRIPAWDSDFWSAYGNKLRVLGTLEEVCNVGSWPT
ncbi:MAG: hypothetical protein Q9222_005314 [Ikaeria aurantiellina]